MILLLLEPRSLDVRGWSMPHPGRLTPVNDPAPIVQEAVWGPEPVRKGIENLDPHRDSIPRTVQPVASHYTD